MAATAPRVLAVDDEPALRELAVAVLEDEGFDVRAAADGRQALTVLAAWPADVILLDLTMPVMDGWAFLEARRGDPALAAIPVVVMSAARPGRPALRALDVARVLPKPSDLDVVCRALAEASAPARRTPRPDGSGAAPW
jgi:CheY-like chemotaxis protein